MTGSTGRAGSGAAGSPGDGPASSRRSPARPTSTGGWCPTTSPAPSPTPTPSTTRVCSPTATTPRCSKCSPSSATSTPRARCSPGPSDEDVHGALERLLIERVGADVGGRLRAGRSRNDQVAALFKSYLRDQGRAISALLLDLVDALAGQARAHLDVAMPGRTHLQHAQPVLLSHHLLGARLAAAPRRRPAPRLGRTGGVGLAVRLGRLGGVQPRPRPASGDGTILGFADSSANSIDGTSARDFVAEFCFVTAMTGVDLSRIAEERSPISTSTCR